MDNRSPEDNEPEPEIDLEEIPLELGEATEDAHVAIVYFDEAVLAAMKRHARSDTSREIAGVLVGQAGPDSRAVLVHGSIQAKHTRASAGNVTFTHESWAEINAEMDSKYPEYVIVGWYHSHPNFGIFLSSYDTFIHKNFFSAPWQVAYVVDPIRGDEGCFVWEDGELVRTPNLKMYMDARFGESDEDVEDAPQMGDPFTAAGGDIGLLAPRRTVVDTGQKIALGVLAVLLAIAVTLQVYTLGEMFKLQKQIKSSNVDITSQLEQLRTQLQGGPVGDGTSVGPDLAAPVGAEENGATTYTIQKGDTLQSISEKLFNSTEYADDIAEYNSLEAGAELGAGNQLKIPVQPDTAEPAASPDGDKPETPVEHNSQ